jgi:hypothetical protein
VVAAFFAAEVSGRVLLLEAALAAANQQMRAYHDLYVAGGPISPASAQEVAEQTTAVLDAQTPVLRAAGEAFSELPPPAISSPLPAIQMIRMLEDMALCGDQLAAVMEETSADVAGSLFEDAPSSAAYAPRVRGVVAILRRAEAWLETIDHETGAHATLPGFAGGRLLAAQLNLQ